MILADMTLRSRGGRSSGFPASTGHAAAAGRIVVHYWGLMPHNGPQDRARSTSAGDWCARDARQDSEVRWHAGRPSNAVRSRMYTAAGPQRRARLMARPLRRGAPWVAGVARVGAGAYGLGAP